MAKRIKIFKSINKFSIFLCLGVFFVANIQAQTKVDLMMLDTVLQLQEQHKINKLATDSTTKVSAVIMHFPYAFYKHYISSQDAFQCSFYPSCANYGFLSVKKNGVIIGILSTFDRLTRCHNKDHLHYPIHISGKLYDPV